MVKGEEGDERKTIMVFEEETKPLILNNTNWTILEDLYGPESDDWLGKKIELYSDPNVMFGKKRTGGVRVRKPSANGHTGPARPIFENFVAASKYCLEHEVSVDALKAWLKSAGLTTFAGVRDSETVYQFVDGEIAARSAEPF